MTDYYVEIYDDNLLGGIGDTEIVAFGNLEFCSSKFFELAAQIQNESDESRAVTLGSDQTDWELNFCMDNGKPLWELEHFSPEDYEDDYCPLDAFSYAEID